MIDTIINFCLFSLLLLFIYVKDRRISVPFILVALYAFIAFMGILHFHDFRSKNRIELWPFLYLIFVCWIYFLPVIKTKGVYRQCADIKITYGLKAMFALYIICAIITIFDQFSLVKSAVLEGKWLMLKAELYNGGSVGVRTNIITNLSGLYVSEFMYAILVYSLYTFTKENISTRKSIFFFLIAVIPYLMTCILYVYRGGFVTISYLTLCIYIMYHKRMMPKKRKILNNCLYTIGSLVIIMILAISLSRFDTSEGGAMTSIINYLGQPMLSFNGGIATIIKSYANGRYFFLNFLGLKKSDVWIDSKYGITTDNGATLDTFVGCSVVDFGFIVSIMIAILVSCLLLRIFSKKNIDFADLYLFTFYLEFLILGVFHCTEGLSLKIFMVLTLYLILKLMGTVKYKNL